MPETTLHPLLQYSQFDLTDGHRCPIIWDLREHPLTSVRHITTPNLILSEFEFSQHATSPPLPLLHIKCGVFSEDWPITAQNEDGVTIRNVLESIHTVVIAQLRQVEWDRHSSKQQDRIAKVFDDRWKAASDPRATWASGVLRVDCLLFHTLFAGLTMEIEGTDSCILTLRRSS